MAHVSLPHAADYDVIVAGGGMAGTAAAIGSAWRGARTLLLERHRCLGGAATMRNVLSLCGLYTLGETPRLAVRGIADRVLHGLKRRKAVSAPMRYRGVFVAFEPEVLKFVLDELAADAGVDVLFGALVVDAERRDGRITSVTIADHGGQSTYRGASFVDCTGDGDLAARAQASTRYGNDGSLNLGTLGTRFGGIPKGVHVAPDDLAASFARQGFPPGVVTKERSVVIRLPVSGDLVVYLASADYDPRDGRSLSRAEASARRQSWAYLDMIRAIPGCENAYLVSSGPELGTRESRHLNCRHQFAWAEIEARKQFDDCIALGAWGAEWHRRDDYSSSFDYPPDKGVYQIPLASLQSIDTPNLLCAGRLADSDRRAGAAIRVMGTGMATGHAAGICATMLAGGAYSPAAVQEQLRRDGAILDEGEVLA